MKESLPQSIAQQEWVARYEQLRGDALSRGRGISTGIGLTVFLRQGLTAWMRACCSVLTASASEFVRPAPVGSLPYGVRAQAVLILAGILLGNRVETN